MKICKAIRDAHKKGQPKFDNLKAELRDFLKPKIEERGWFYSDRVKALESFSLKIETGRVANINDLEDFFGCTIIVPNLMHIQNACFLIEKDFHILERRPPKDDETHKNASDFTFDDLRLYVKRKPAVGRFRETDELKFEIQLKTILQYAWGIATHDLIYKTDDVSWSKARIAFQVKAMLEHSELVIAEASSLSSAPAVSKQDKYTKNILLTIEQLKITWGADHLPSNLKQLSETINKLLVAIECSPTELKTIIDIERQRIGIIPLDLSPYAFILQALINSTTLKFEEKFKRSRKLSIVIHKGMDLPEWIKTNNNKIINLD